MGPRSVKHLHQLFAGPWTIEKAYWLGFFYGDGSVFNRGAQLKLGCVDTEHVLRFKNALQSDYALSLSQSRGQTNCLCYHNVTNKQFAESLINLGCTPRKAKTLMFPSDELLPSDMLSHFIRGNFDADGSVCWTKRYVCVSFNGNLNFLDQMQNKICSSLDFKPVKIVPHSRGSDCFKLIYGGRLKPIKILDWIYYDSTDETRLPRKYLRYQRFTEFMNIPWSERQKYYEEWRNSQEYVDLHSCCMSVPSRAAMFPGLKCPRCLDKKTVRLL